MISALGAVTLPLNANSKSSFSVNRFLSYSVIAILTFHSETPLAVQVIVALEGSLGLTSTAILDGDLQSKDLENVTSSTLTLLV